MPTPTPELGLQKGVDADDTADYLTISLANSLGTIDALFNNVSGHTHAGPHQGGPISSTSIKGAVDIPDWFRSTGHTTPYATSGTGLEMWYDPAQGGVVSTYNRATNQYGETQLVGNPIVISIGGVGPAMSVDSSRNVGFGANIITLGGGTIGDGGPDPVVSGQRLVGINALTVTPGHIYGAGMQINGPSIFSGATTFNATVSIAAGSNISMSAGSSIGSPDNLTLSGQGAISTQAGPLYLRSATGAISMDSGGLSVAGSVTAGGNLSTPNVVTAGQFNLGSGGPQPPYILPVSGSIRYAALSPGTHSFEYVQGGYGPCVGASFTPSSARRFKTDILTLVDPLEIVTDQRVHGVSYTEIASGDHKIGFVADDWLPVLPEVVVLDDIGDVLALDYDRISAVTFEALKTYVARTEARLAALEAKAA